MPLRIEAKGRRSAVLLCVLLIHGIVVDLLVRATRLHFAVGQNSHAFTVDLLPGILRPEMRESRPKIAVSKPVRNADKQASPALPAESQATTGNESAPNSAISPPPIDWDLEAAIVARGSVGKRLYRDLAGFTPEQLEWMKRNQMAPAPYNPFWDEHHRADEPGVLWISDDCAIVNLMPVCRLKVGKRQVRGDLFKDMRKYLEDRELEPLP